MIGTWPSGFICFYLSGGSLPTCCCHIPGHPRYSVLLPCAGDCSLVFYFMIWDALVVSCLFTTLPQLTHRLSGCSLSDLLSGLRLLRCIFSSPFVFMFYFSWPLLALSHISTSHLFLACLPAYRYN